MTDSNELDGIKQLLGRVVTQLEAMTTQITELMPLKPVSREYKHEERKSAESLTTGVHGIRQLADTILGKKDQPEGGPK
jgi:hypothetical protein